MIKLGLENLFTVNNFAYICPHDATKQNSWEQKMLPNRGYPLKLYESAKSVLQGVYFYYLRLEHTIASCLF